MYGGVAVRRRTLLLSLGVFLTIAIATTPASARSQRNLAYRADQVWATSVRLLRVDLGFELLERDRDARYILFRYSDGEQEHAGSLEIVERTPDEGVLGVMIIVSIAAMPTYVELHLIDRLERKLREEVGPPIQPPRPVRTPEPDDDEEDEEDDDEDDEEDDD